MMPKPTPFKIISDIVSKTDHPWEYEPDLYEWTYRGIECVARRNLTHGAWCGYVDVPREVWSIFKVDDDHSLDDRIDVHGGVTYAENSLDKDAFRVGFDCAHAHDLLPKVHPNKNLATHLKEKSGLVVEDEVYRDLAFVIAECESMVDQILEVTGDINNNLT
jgi:hypothetical protein